MGAGKNIRGPVKHMPQRRPPGESIGDSGGNAALYCPDDAPPPAAPPPPVFVMAPGAPPFVAGGASTLFDQDKNCDVVMRSGQH